jgi:hypothetical protein
VPDTRPNRAGFRSLSDQSAKITIDSLDLDGGDSLRQEGRTVACGEPREIVDFTLERKLPSMGVGPGHGDLILKLFVAAPFLAMIVLASGAEAGSGDLPEAVVGLGGRMGCRVLGETPPGTTPAWIVAREAGTAYAAWCARQSGGRLVYDLLVAATSPEHPWHRCPSHVRLGLQLGVQEPLPRLRATMLPRDLPYPMKLAEFWYLRGDDFLVEQGPQVHGSGIPSGPGLDFGADDAGQILVCLGGRWIMGGYH